MRSAARTGGLRLEGPVGGTWTGDAVLAWDGRRGGAYDPSTDRWRGFVVSQGLHARACVPTTV